MKQVRKLTAERRPPQGPVEMEQAYLGALGQLKQRRKKRRKVSKRIMSSALSSAR